MQGHRLPDDSELEALTPGDYVLRGSFLWVRLPTGTLGRLDPDRWTWAADEDRALTVTPSIDARDDWHGYLEHGVWRQV